MLRPWVVVRERYWGIAVSGRCSIGGLWRLAGAEETGPATGLWYARPGPVYTPEIIVRTSVQ